MSIRHHYIDPDPSAWGNLGCNAASDAAERAEAHRVRVAEALRYVRTIAPDGDPDADWLTPDQARLVTLANDVVGLRTRPRP